jgi:hypothetical protein
MKKTKKKLLEEALKKVTQYLNKPDADLSIVSAYLRDLADWIDAPVAESSDPVPPPPPPPGHQ